MEKKMLIAFDDSEYSMRAVEMVAGHFTKDYRITILSLIPDSTAICNMYSPELAPHFLSEQGIFCSIDEKNRELMIQAQEKAKGVLLNKGFAEENIQSKIATTKRGVARDIVDEAQSGYSTVVLGRRGLSGIKEFFLGSVSQKVLNSVKNISVLIVD